MLKIIESTQFTSKDLLNFWIRRWFRTLPNYFLVLLLIIAYHLVIFHRPPPRFTWDFVFFFQNFAWPHPIFFQEAWSLAVEEWFYLLFPLSYFIINKGIKKKTNALFYCVAFFLLIPLVIRIVKYASGWDLQEFDEGYRKIVVFRLDGLMYGIIAAWIYRYKKSFWIRYKYVFLGVGILLALILSFVKDETLKFCPPIYFDIESVIVLCFMPFFSELNTTGSRFFDGVFEGISKLSYALYLINLTLVTYCFIPSLDNLLGWKNVPIEEIYRYNYIIYWVCCFAGSAAIYFFYERHMTPFRDRFNFGSKRPQATKS